MVISGHQWPSLAISHHQSPSVIISDHQRPSAAISGHQRPFVAISGHPVVLDALVWQRGGVGWCGGGHSRRCSGRRGGERSQRLDVTRLRSHNMPLSGHAPPTRTSSNKRTVPASSGVTRPHSGPTGEWEHMPTPCSSNGRTREPRMWRTCHPHLSARWDLGAARPLGQASLQSGSSVESHHVCQPKRCGAPCSLPCRLHAAGSRGSE